MCFDKFDGMELKPDSGAPVLLVMQWKRRSGGGREKDNKRGRFAPGVLEGHCFTPCLSTLTQHLVLSTETTGPGAQVDLWGEGGAGGSVFPEHDVVPALVDYMYLLGRCIRRGVGGV
jgi:hypothetical protein